MTSEIPESGKKRSSEDFKLPTTSFSEEDFFEVSAHMGDKSERATSLQEDLQNIEKNINEQPLSLQKVFSEIKGKFVKKVEIDGKKFLFANMVVGMRDQILALVEDEKVSGKWKIRVFRFSGSDHQWKAYPGKRDETSSMKGEEDNPMHHYVQSAKLHKDLYKFISTLPKVSEHAHYSRYLPRKSSKESKGQFEDEFELREKYQTLKNPEWAKFQGWCQDFYGGYEFMVADERDREDHSEKSTFYKVLGRSTASEMKNIKTCLDEILQSKDEGLRYWFEHQTIFMMDRSDDPRVKKFIEVYKENMGAYLEKAFSVAPPKSILPDFSISNRIDSYIKKEVNDKNDIHIEEYKVKSPEGDELVFAMAYDNDGRVYIDNIYDPGVGMNDYGTLDTITNMGHLVYKPEDYRNQVFAIPDKYKISAGTYTDISALWEKIPIIKNFKQELMRRGVLKQS